jgi:hypothetical protein
VLGRRDPQRSFFGAISQLGVEAVEKMGFYGKLGVKLNDLFRDVDFEACYSERIGRPSVPPSMLAGARLLQHHDGISDREVVERCRFDTRWKVALDLDLATIEAPFAKSTYQAFRARLTLHAAEGAAFEKSVRTAKDEGLLPRRLTVALDSSPVRGKGAVKDTFNLLSDAIAGVIRSVARDRGAKATEVSAEVGLERHIEAASIKGSEIVDWDKEEDVRRFLGGLVEDCKKAVELAEIADCASSEVDLLKRVIDQDVETGDEGGPRIKQGVAKGRMPSVTDPEMRHGHKSSGKAYSGHKAHVAVDTDSGIITGLGVGAPGASDGDRLQELVEQSKVTTGSEVGEVLGDTAYATREAVRQAEKCGVELTTKMPSPPKDKFGPRHFQVSQDLRQAECPDGHPSSKSVRRGDGFLHKWSPDECKNCPLKQRCMREGAKQRTLLVALDFHDRRRREEVASSLEGRLLLRQRIVVEHAIGRIKNLGAGTARYFGQLRTLAQWQWAAAVVNLTIVWGREAALTT